MNEIRVYLIDTDLLLADINYSELTDEEFMEEAEEQGGVYSLQGFQNAFNYSDINANAEVIRFITIKTD